MKENEINDLKKIQKQSDYSYNLAVFSAMIVMIGVITSLDIIVIVFLGLMILFVIDRRYWDTKYYMIKNLNRLKMKQGSKK